MPSSTHDTKQEGQLQLGLQVMSGKDWTGGAQYIRNLISCLATLPEPEQPVVRLFGVGIEDALERELKALPLVDPSPIIDPSVMSRHSFIRVLQRALKRGSALIRGHAPSPQRAIDITYGLGGLPGVPQIRWIPDLQHVYLPHFFFAEELQKRTDYMSALANSKGLVVFSSKAARDDFLRLHPHPVATTAIWSFCTTITERDEGGRNPHEAYGLPVKYAYLPNQFWAHKNHITVFKALAQLQNRGVTVPLVCTGLERDYRNPTHFTELMHYLSENGLDGTVRCLGLVPRNDQMEIFRHAAVVIQPSLFEGWSTVVEDTKSIGRPIIASDLPVHKEQLEAYDRAWFFHPTDAEQLMLLLEQLWPKLDPGPEPERERMAADRTRARSLEAAREFMAMVRHAQRLLEKAR